MTGIEIDTLFTVGQISGAIIAITGALAILHRIFFKKITDQLTKINQELHPNGGSSMRDAINRIEKVQDEMKSDIKDVREKVDDHISWHLNQ